MFFSIDDDDKFENFERYEDGLFFEGGGDKTKKGDSKAKDAPADMEATPVDPTLDVHGLKKQEPHVYVEKPNAFLKCFKKIFTKLYPYNSVETITGWGKVLKKYLFAATMSHSAFIGISLALIGFEPMIYNMWLACLAYSCYLTLNNCTICTYIIFLFMAISGGITWACQYRGTEAQHTSCTTSDNKTSSSSSSSSSGKTSTNNCTSTGGGGYSGGLHETQSISLIVCICFYIAALVLVLRALWFFRKTGGIRGLNKTSGLIEDKILGGAAAIGGAIAAKSSDQIDKQDKKDLKEENDQNAILLAAASTKEGQHMAIEASKNKIVQDQALKAAKNPEMQKMALNAAKNPEVQKAALSAAQNPEVQKALMSGGSAMLKAAMK